jgi:hypothetical protein
MCFGSSNASGVTALQQQQQAGLQQGSQAIQQAYQGFTPQFYQGVEQNYINQAEPQLNQQYQQQGKNLNFSLANQGITNSSAGQNLGTSLGQAFNQQQQGVVNSAQGAAQQVQQNVANQQAQLYNELGSSYNPTTAAENAANLAAQTAAPSVFPPLGNMFQTWANTYLTGQNDSQANNQATWLYPYLLSSLNNQSVGALPP